MKQTTADSYARVPMRWVGPLRITGAEMREDVSAPLATYETPLWPSVARGARVSMACAGIQAAVLDERMTRSVCVQAPNVEAAQLALSCLRARRADWDAVVAAGSRYAKLLDIHAETVGSLIYIRFAFSTGDAAGHNMVTAASDKLLDALLDMLPDLRYVSVSGNFCADKKVSAVNGLLGRGKRVVAEMRVPRALCERLLKTTPEALADLNVKKNLMGSIVAGSLRSANAHFANMLLAFYLATGQDAANIVEGSQGFTFAEVDGDDLAFSVTLPNLIVGAVGSGKDAEWVRENLERMGCLGEAPPGRRARRLALICASVVLCGELSLLAALTRRGELMRAHIKMERG